MITNQGFTVEPWAIRERDLNMDTLAQTESVFALSNGHIGMRGNLDEGEPHGLPGTYLNSVYEQRPLPYAEAGYGDPESGQTVVNVTNGKLIRLLVDDEPFEIRYGRLHDHERLLDLRAGTLTRSAHWSSPSGCGVRVSSTRLVSFAQRAVAAISYEVEAVDRRARIVVQSELVANESSAAQSKDPRAAVALQSPLVVEDNVVGDGTAILVHRTRDSGLRIAAAMRHDVDGPDGTEVDLVGGGDVGRLTVVTSLEPGQRLRLVKLLAYGWSAERSRPAMRDQVMAALAGARSTGWDGLVSEQRAFLDDFWSGADVEIDGDPQVQQAVRFALFHILQAGARAEQRPIPAKGLTGPGYDGHIFWDTEGFIMPVLSYTYPRAAADALDWRRTTLPQAEVRAKRLGIQGAAFPWRTIHGEECSGYWPAGTAAFHINADIAAAVARYVDATDDTEFERETGLPLLVATARLWRGIGHHDINGLFRIDGVTGPDEYSALADNNVYTNLMAQRNLRAAADAVARHPNEAERLGVTADEAASWRGAADATFVPFDDDLGVHPQSEGFTEHARWDFAATEAEHYPLMLHFPYFELYRKQVVKQADLVLAMYLCDDAFTFEEKIANFAYYEAITVRDSSLSAAVQAVIAAEIGLLDLAYDYLGEAALMDLDDLERNTRDGLHIAALAGAWTALVAGFGGMRAREGRIRFDPRLPDGITRLAFRLCYRGRRLRVVVTDDTTTYHLLEGEPLSVTHHGEEVELGDQPATVPTPVTESPGCWIRHPCGREPLPRRVGTSTRDRSPA